MLFVFRRGFLLLIAFAFSGVQYICAQSGGVLINEYSFHGENLFIELKSEEREQSLEHYYIAICDFAPLSGQGTKKNTLNMRALIDLKGKMISLIVILGTFGFNF